MMKGWECPICGKGLAPHVNECNCKHASTPFEEYQKQFHPGRYWEIDPKYANGWWGIYPPVITPSVWVGDLTLDTITVTVGPDGKIIYPEATTPSA